MADLKAGDKVWYVPDHCHALDLAKLPDGSVGHAFHFACTQNSPQHGLKAGDLVEHPQFGAITSRTETGHLQTGSGLVIRPHAPKFYWPAVVAPRHDVILDGFVTHGSAVVSGLAHTSQVEAGVTTVGGRFTPFPAGAVVARVDSDSQVTLSAPADLGGAGAGVFRLVFSHPGLQLDIDHPLDAWTLHYKLDGPNQVRHDAAAKRPHTYHLAGE